MTSRADRYARAGLIGSIALLALFVSVTSAIHFSLNIVIKAVDSVPKTVGQALETSPVVGGISAIVSLIKNSRLT
jgi:hypothetical protein